MHVFYHKLVNASCTYLASIIPEDRLWLRLYRKRPYLQMSHHCGHPLLLHPLQRVRERERRGRRWWRNLDNPKRFITMHVSKTEQGTPEHVYQWYAVARNFLYKACNRFKPAERSHKRPTRNGCLKCIETELRKYMQFSFLSVWALLCKWNLKYVTTLPPPPPPTPPPNQRQAEYQTTKYVPQRWPLHKSCERRCVALPRRPHSTAASRSWRRRLELSPELQTLEPATAEKKRERYHCLAPECGVAHLVYRLVGLVVKASASRAEDPGFESRLRRDLIGVESYQWLKNWRSSGYPARRLAL